MFLSHVVVAVAAEVEVVEKQEQVEVVKGRTSQMRTILLLLQMLL